MLRDQKGRFKSGRNQIRVAVVIVLLLAGNLYQLKASNKAAEANLDGLRARHFELVQQVNAITDATARASITITEPERWKIKEPVEVTGYACPTPQTVSEWTPEDIKMNCPSWNGSHGTTKSGTIPKAGRTAACPRDMLGQTITIDGYGTRVCEDTGGAIKSGKVDIFAENKGEAYKIGRHTAYMAR